MADAPCMTDADSSRSIEDGALYTVKERLETFKNCSWPFDSGSCTPVKMAEAGFYYCGTAQAPDWVRCVVCHQDMDGWEENDDPRVEHKRFQPKCAFLKIKDPYAITVGDCIDIERVAQENYIAMEKVKLEADLDSYIAEMKEQLVEALEKAKQGKKKH